MAEKDKVCCMFSDPVPGHAVDNRDLESLAGDEWSRKEHKIYRCRRCGAYVMYKYEENIGYGGWDNVDISEDYIPIAEPEILDGEYSIDGKVISGARCISARYMEADWRHDRDWFYR